MRLTVRTNLAMRALMYCAVHPGQYVRKGDVARVCHASENHLAQVINGLSHSGFIETQRGRNGGIRLAKPADQINLGAVFRSLEAAVPFAECFSETENTCPLTPFCLLRPTLARAIASFYDTLDEQTVADLTEGNTALSDFMNDGVDAPMTRGPGRARSMPPDQISETSISETSISKTAISKTAVRAAEAG